MSRPAGAIVLAALAGAALACAGPAGTALAAFGAPTELATSPSGLGIAADTDAAGATTLLVTSGDHGPRLFERPRGGPWPAPTPLPGSPKGVAGPVLDAAGDGALGIAWRVDSPRHYGAIAVAMRDPGGALGAPATVVGPEAGGVRYPALAVAPSGEALLAYSTGTSEAHLNMRGAVAVSHRDAHGSFSQPEIVDRTLSGTPEVAIASDGSGIVAWAHSRRVYVVSVAAGGEIGKVKSLRSVVGIGGLSVAAGDDGAATVAWVNHTYSGPRGHRRSRYHVWALTRRAGHAFGAPAVVASTPDYLRDLALRADEDGRVTLAWSPENFGRNHTIGQNGITSSVQATTAPAGSAFPAPRTVAPRTDLYLASPALAVASGRIALAWSTTASRNDIGVQAAAGPARRPGAPQTLDRRQVAVGYYLSSRPVAVTIGPGGATTVLYVAPTENADRTLIYHLLAADGP